MNIFYAPPSQVQGEVIELQGQEAIHASKALRYQRGDDIVTVDGVGGWYEGKVQAISGKRVRIAVDKSAIKRRPQPKIMLGIGIIKKRDRLEFAVEKAVELGVKEIAVFRSDHAVKQNVRLDRLESTAVAAMKQSLRVWLPAVHVYSNFNEMVDAYSSDTLLVAHQNRPSLADVLQGKKISHPFLLVGPEGGFSDRELHFLEEHQARMVSLGASRLRTETAAVTFLNQYKAAISF